MIPHFFMMSSNYVFCFLVLIETSSGRNYISCVQILLKWYLNDFSPYCLIAIIMRTVLLQPMLYSTKGAVSDLIDLPVRQASLNEVYDTVRCKAIQSIVHGYRNTTKMRN